MRVERAVLQVVLTLAVTLGLGCGADPPPSSPNKGDSDKPPRRDVPTIGGGTSDRDAGSSPDGRESPASADTTSRPYTTRPAPGIWRLSPDAGSWETFAEPDRPSRKAPQAEIVAAFDIEQSGYALVVTTERIHRLHLHPPEWEAGRSLSDVARVLDEADIRVAYSDATKSPNDEIIFVGLHNGSPRRWQGQYDIEKKKVGDIQAGETLRWSSRAPETLKLIAAWRDNANRHDWLSGGEPCDAVPEDGFGPYVGYLTAERIYFADATYCEGYFTATLLERAPWPTTDRPPIDQIGATFWHRGSLYVIAAN